MPKIVDPDNLTSNTSVFWYTGSLTERTIGVSSSADSVGSLIPPLESGSDSGVTLQCLYSFAKEEWKNDDTLIRIPFPFVSITKNQFDLINYWDFANDASRYLIRDSGWSVISGSVTTQEWVGIRTLGNIALDDTTIPPDQTLSDQVYFVQSGSTESGGDGESLVNAIQNFKMSGSVNQAINHYSASSATGTLVVDRNFRTSTDLYVREYKKIYDDANIQNDLGVTTQEYTLYSVPLQNSVDLKITTDTESEATTQGPWRHVDIYFLSGSGFQKFVPSVASPAGLVVSGSDGQWYITNAGGSNSGTVSPPGTPDGDTTYTLYAMTSSIGGYSPSGSQQISGSGEYSVFNVVITNGTGSAAKTGSISDVYTSVQYQLRQEADIDKAVHFAAETFIGKRTRLLLSFVGDTLVTSNGVFVDNQQDADTNSIDFYDVSGSVVRYPFVATGTITFNDNLKNDASGEYYMFFTTTNDASGSFGLADAVIVQDNSSVFITGSTSGSTSVSFTYDYDGNEQRGTGSGGSNADVTLVAIGLNTAQYVTVTSTILRTKTNNISLVSTLERNYENPA